MLTSLDRHGDTPRLAALGFAAYLTKPVRVRELLDAVARVMGGGPRQWQMETQPMITLNMLTQPAAQRRFGGQVLLVEDNFVNQKVAVKFLERLGCTVEVASNGAEGDCRLSKAAPFDIDSDGCANAGHGRHDCHAQDPRTGDSTNMCPSSR